MKTITVEDIAKRFGKDPSHIRRLSIQNGWGEVLFGRIRVYSQREVDKFARLFAESGRVSKNSKNLVKAG